MRQAILAIALLGLLAGCGEQASAPAVATAPAVGIDPKVARVVEDWPLPVRLPGNALPDLAAGPGGRLLLLWTNSPPGRRHALQFATWDPAALRWESPPMTIAVGNSMFTNWADTAHIAATPDGALWVHWLQKNGDAPYAYDIMLSTSRNGGMRWSEPLRPHDDGTQTEHGFAALWPQGQDTLGIAWLDGRNTAGASHDGHEAHDTGADHADPSGGGAMTLRAASFGPDLRRALDAEIDPRVCDCCQTDVAMTAQGPLLVYRGRGADEIRDILATRLDGEAWTAPAPVHADGWKMPACPVNGPAVAAEGDTAVVAWYTAPGGEPLLRAAHSADAGGSFAAPVELDRGEALQGRVDVALADGQAWILWLREDAQAGQSLWLSRRSPDLATEYQRIEVAKVAGRGRGTGFPQLAVAGGVAHVVWTELDDGVAQLRGARILAR